MQQFDFTPLYRSTVGFDTLFNMLDNFGGVDAASGYPPYNIEKQDENAYRISLALAGFSDEDLDIEVKENRLLITGKKAADDKTDYLHQGIAARAFERTFQLADHVEVVGAHLENGLLHIDLKRELPEKMKARKVAISNVNGTPQTIEAD